MARPASSIMSGPASAMSGLNECRPDERERLAAYIAMSARFISASGARSGSSDDATAMPTLGRSSIFSPSMTNGWSKASTTRPATR